MRLMNKIVDGFLLQKQFSLSIALGQSSTVQLTWQKGSLHSQYTHRSS